MCFSAGASFTAGVLLTVVGTKTIQKVHKPSQAVFAGLPLFFALQQFTEGVLWLVIGRAGFGTIQVISTLVFLTLAQLVWPLVVPLSVLLLEKDRVRKNILYALLAVGALIALINLYIMVFCNTRAQVSGMHIAYISDFNIQLGPMAVAAYLSVTIAPLFISSIRRMHLLGTIMGVSFLVSYLFYTQCLTSVWCFFAALMSFMVYYIVRDEHTAFHLSEIPVS